MSARKIKTTRRDFIKTTSGAVLGTTVLPESVFAHGLNIEQIIEPAGPVSKYVPTIKATFVRRKEDYGMWWPGAIYDGNAALKKYTSELRKNANELGIKIDIRSMPIYSIDEADQWLAKAKAEKPDGLVVVLLDRQQHAWPTAIKAIKSKIPSVIFAPVGSAFTTNTMQIPDKTGSFICSTDDFNQVTYGMKMIKAGAKLRETRFIVIKGDKRFNSEIKPFGTKLRYIPAKIFIDEYNRTPLSSEIENIASEYIQHATKVSGPSKQDVLNGVKSYVVIRNILKREKGDGITMDCLGALANSKISLPCIAWSWMNDHGIPAACEADLGACLTHALVQYLFDRPGFQQDPVPETAKDCLIGAHCTCATKLNGFDQPAEPYYLSHHHGNRDAVPRTMWRVGQRMTLADIVIDQKGDKQPEMIISSGVVVDNVAVPPAGGCVVSVMVKLDGVTDYLDYPGFHQIFFYGDYKKQLINYCTLFGIKPVVL